MTVHHDTFPDPARPGVGAVLLGEPPRGTAPDRLLASWREGARPAGLLSLTVLAGTDDDRLLTYGQWTDGDAGRAAMAGLADAGPQTEFRLYRSGVREDPPPTGCVVAVRVEFDGPDPERQRRWVDTVFEALESEREPHPGGISAHFHVSVDGTRVFNYAEWTDEAAHRDALTRSGQGAVGPSPVWRRVHAFPGVRGSEVRRHRLAGSLSRPNEEARH